MTAGSPRTWATNEYITATKFNGEIRDQLLVKANAPRCYLWKSVKIGAPMTNGASDDYLAWTRNIWPLHLDQVLYDVSFDGTRMAMGDGRVLIHRPGLYRFNAAVTFGTLQSKTNDTGAFAAGNGTRAAYIGKNMNGLFCSNPTAAGVDPIFDQKTEFIESIQNPVSDLTPMVRTVRVRGSMRADRGDHFQLFWREDAAELDCIPSQGTCFLQARWEAS